MIFRRNLLAIASGCSLLTTGCRSISQEWTSRKDAVSAHNQMMLVRESPMTLGYRRLIAKSEQSADLKIFIGQTGMPDFLAEATSGNRDYLIFYYLDRRKAFACRTSARSSGAVEFTGPYQMTPGELRLLKAAKSKADQIAVAG
jgi:hypothetical protein